MDGARYRLAAALAIDRIGKGSDLVETHIGFRFIQLDADVLLAEAPGKVEPGLGDAGLRHEAVIVDKPWRDDLQFQIVDPVVGIVLELAPQISAAPCRRQRGAGIAKAGGGARVHGNPRGLVTAAKIKLAVYARHYIAAGSAVVAHGGESADDAPFEVPARARETGQRLVALHIGCRFIGAAAQHDAAVAVAQAHRRGIGPGRAPCRAHAPGRIGHCTRIERRQRQPEHIGALEEKAALFRQTQCDAAGAADRFIDLDLRKVGIERGVEHPVGARPGVDFDPEAGPFAAAHRQLRAHVDEAAIAHRRDRPVHSRDRRHVGQVIAAAGFQRHTQQQFATIVRHTAFDHHAPGLAVTVRKAQARQRPAHFHAVAVGQDLDRGIDRVVGTEVVVGIAAADAVGEHAGDIDAHKLR
ncbi:hypothetical protein CR105_08815 [Massilia eurypsychrophila]|uniref:Uncharacterized protein n=1 Tax=Massilia eurypsychrophila TaxID=1485217 RepID=A0A2G8TGX3_9BURK|nr:hypothetical protein CR105_08815 [Massilia eurypsychrophila]